MPHSPASCGMQALVAPTVLLAKLSCLLLDLCMRMTNGRWDLRLGPVLDRDVCCQPVPASEGVCGVLTTWARQRTRLGSSDRVSQACQATLACPTTDREDAAEPERLLPNPCGMFHGLPASLLA